MLKEYANEKKWINYLYFPLFIKKRNIRPAVPHIATQISPTKETRTQFLKHDQMSFAFGRL